MIPQDVTERVLADRLAALGGTIHRGVTATAASQDANGARVTVASAAGTQIIAARYVVAGDGLDSLVRRAAGIGFDGEPAEGSFVLADVRMDWPLGRDEVSLFFSRAGDGRGGAAAGRGVPHRRQPRRRARASGGRGDPGADRQRAARSAPSRVAEVIWSSRFRIHHRVARTYRAGRFLLMGDAAHVHSPAGGQGMNTGLVDAVVLGRVLAEVVEGRRSEAALDDYATMRRAAAVEVLALAGRLTRLAVTRSAPQRAIRNALFTLVAHLPPARRHLAMSLSGLARRHLAAAAPAAATHPAPTVAAKAA